MRVNLGSDLNRRCEVWGKTEGTARDILGQKTVTKQKLFEAWCSIVPQTGSLLEGRSGETALSQTTHKVIMRYRRDLTPDMWIVYGGQRYDILYILDPYLRHERLEVFCEARFGDA